MRIPVPSPCVLSNYGYSNTKCFTCPITTVISFSEVVSRIPEIAIVFSAKQISSAGCVFKTVTITSSLLARICFQAAVAFSTSAHSPQARILVFKWVVYKVRVKPRGGPETICWEIVPPFQTLNSGIILNRIRLLLSCWARQHILIGDVQCPGRNSMILLHIRIINDI